MKNFNADTPIVRLRIKQKALNIDLNKLKREITTELGTERKRRDILKQISSTEKSLQEINKLIKEEKRIAVKQYTKQTEDMFRTLPKRLNSTFEKQDKTIDEQLTIQNTDPDIIERDISIGTQATSLPSTIPSVTFSIYSDETAAINTLTSEPNPQMEPTRSNMQKINKMNENTKGAIPKLRRTTRTLDFTTLEPTESTSRFELPRQRSESNTLKLQQNVATTLDAPGILTQTYALPKMSTEQVKSRNEFEDFFNINRNIAQSSELTNYQIEHGNIYDPNLASNFPVKESHTRNQKEKIEPYGKHIR